MKPVKYEEKDFTLINEYAQHVHALNHLWWFDEQGNRLELNFPERMSLVISEVSEALEGFRKDLMDDHLPEHRSILVELADGMIRILDCAGAYNWLISYGKLDYLVPTNETLISARLLNLSDFAVRTAWATKSDDPRRWLRGELTYHFLSESIEIAALAGCHDIWQIVYEKLEYNQKRLDHQYAARALPGGKKF